jgi:hypothetical protein
MATLANLIFIKPYCEKKHEPKHVSQNTLIPNELWGRIIEYLPAQSAIQLSAVNRNLNWICCHSEESQAYWNDQIKNRFPKTVFKGDTPFETYTHCEQVEKRIATRQFRKEEILDHWLFYSDVKNIKKQFPKMNEIPFSRGRRDESITLLEGDYQFIGSENGKLCITNLHTGERTKVFNKVEKHGSMLFVVDKIAVSSGRILRYCYDYLLDEHNELGCCEILFCQKREYRYQLIDLNKDVPQTSWNMPSWSRLSQNLSSFTHALLGAYIDPGPQFKDALMELEDQDQK